MFRQAWHSFAVNRTQAHLVVARLAKTPEQGPTLKSVRALLVRVVRQGAPNGDYASTIVRQAGNDEVHFAFSRETDALWLANRLAAQSVTSFPGWISGHLVMINEKELAALERSYPPSERRSKVRDAEPRSWRFSADLQDVWRSRKPRDS